MLPWQQFDVVRYIFCIYTSSKIQLLNHTIHNIRHGYMLYMPSSGFQRFMWIYHPAI